LAYFRFRPEKYWKDREARHLYEGAMHPSIAQDTVVFDDCIAGMESMSAESVDLVIADPPFGLGFSGKESVYNRNDDLVIDFYQDVDEKYGEFTEEWMALIQKVMRPHATAYVFSGWTHLEEVLRGARKAGLATINHLIWKYQFGVFTKRKYVSSHYHILWLAKDPEKYFFNKLEHYPEDVWIISRKYKPGQCKNGNTLPEAVVRNCIEFSSKPGDLVFDPFMGMATTAVASKGTWRHFFGFEINKLLEPAVTRRIGNKKLGRDYVSLEKRLERIADYAKEKYPRAYELYKQGIAGDYYDNS
jgi:site-specific DNA-methyltransferase (adenine-specific)